MKFKILFIFLLLFIITGCSYQELNDLAIISGIGIDYINESDNYVITAEILDLKKNGEGSTIKSVFYEGVGSSVPDAIRNIMKSYPKTVYLGHLELIIYGKSALDKIDAGFDYFFSSPEASTEIYILASTENDAKDFFNIEDEYENNSPTENLVSMIENTNDYQGGAFKSKFEEFYAHYFDEGIDPVLVTIKKNNDAKANETIISNIAPYKNAYLLPILSSDSSIAYNIIFNNFKDIMLSDIYDSKPLTVFLFNPKSDIEVDIKDDIKININIKLDGHISEIHTYLNVTDASVKEKIKEIISNKISNYITSLIDYSINNNVDILGVKNEIYKNDYNNYYKYKDLNIYKNARININVDLDIFRYGIMYKGSGK